MALVIDQVPQERLDVTIDDRGIAHVEAIILREGPMRYVRPGIGARWEHVSADEVKRAAKTASAAPITDGHPPDFLDPDTVHQHVQGLGSPEVELVQIESDDPDQPERVGLMQDLMIHNPGLVEDIESGKKQVSTGRDIDFKDEAGVWQGIEYQVQQVNTVVNHIAIVESGRCGAMCSIIEGTRTEGQQLDPDVEECVRSVKEEGKGKSEAIAICKEAVDRGTFRNRILAIMDPMEADNGELMERVGRIVKRDAEEVQRVITETEEEPSESIIKALAQVLGVKQSRILRWARQEFGDSFALSSEDAYSDTSDESDEELETESGKGNSRKGSKSMKIEIAGETFALDGVCDCEDDELTDTLRKIEDHANKAVSDLTTVLDEVGEGEAEDGDDEGSTEDEQAEDMDLAAMLKSARQEVGMEVAEVAEEVQATPQMLQAIESGEAPLTEDLAVQLVEVLELEASDLISAMAGESQKATEGPSEESGQEVPEQTQGGTHKEKRMDSPDSDTETEDSDMSNDEVINLVGEIKALDSSFDYEGEDTHELKLTLLEKLKGTAVDEMDEEVGARVQDSADYCEGMIDAEIERRQSAAEDSEDEEREVEPSTSSDSGKTEDSNRMSIEEMKDAYGNPGKYEDRLQK